MRERVREDRELKIPPARLIGSVFMCAGLLKNQHSSIGVGFSLEPISKIAQRCRFYVFPSREGGKISIHDGFK